MTNEQRDAIATINDELWTLAKKLVSLRVRAKRAEEWDLVRQLDSDLGEVNDAFGRLVVLQDKWLKGEEV